MGLTFFTPGPSQLFPTIPLYMQKALKENICSISHRSKSFENIFINTVQGLHTLLNIPQDYKIFFLSSGTEAMERIIENCVETESFHFINGSFSNRFFLTAQEIKKNPKKYEVALGNGFDFENINVPKESELICLTHNETSTGVILPLEKVYPFRKKHPNALFALDIVSSAPLTEVDFSQFDTIFFSVQKGFGLPAGLGVLIVSPKAMEKATYLYKKNISIGSYHNFISLVKYEEKHQTAETPSVLHIYLLGEIVQEMLTAGIERIRKDIEQRAESLYSFLDHSNNLQAFVKEHAFRSPTVIVMQTGSKTIRIKKYLEGKGLIVGSGYGKNKEVQLRVANFPAIPSSETEKLIKYLEEFQNI